MYRSRLLNGEYSAPENLGTPLNSEFNQGDAVTAPDQSFLILTINGRPDDTGIGDLYISEQTAGAFCPSLSPDGQYLYFTSTRGFRVEPLVEPPQRPLNYKGLTSRLHGVLNGLGNVYRVPMAAVRPFVPEWDVQVELSRSPKRYAR